MGLLLAYGPAGDIIAVLDGMVILHFETQRALGHADFGAAEAQGIESTAFWRLTTYGGDKHGRRVLRNPQPVKGSKFWPEALGGQAHQFWAELDGPAGDKLIVALVHKGSGHVRERAAIEAKAAEAKASGKPLVNIL